MSASSVSEAVKACPREFRKRLYIDADGKRVRLDDVADSFQRDDFAALDGMMQRAAGRKVTHAPHYKFAMLERPRGHSKTSDIATHCTYWLNAAERALRGVVVAADSEQAEILITAIETLVLLNKPLANIQVFRDRVVNTATGAELAVMSSDEGSSYGILPSLVVLDELSHWGEGSEGLFGSLLASAVKRESCALVAISNAGWHASWQWLVREAARESPAWYFHALPGPEASWISPEMLEEQKRFLPFSEFNRQWLNQWSDLSGDYLDPEKIAACTTLPGSFWDHPRSGSWQFCGGLDLGVRRDRSSFVVLATQRLSNRVAVASVQTWLPPRGGEVDLASVEQAVLRAHRRFNLESVHVDPWQASLMVQNLIRANVNAIVTHFTPTNQTRMAMALMESIASETLDLYSDPQLLQDLGKVAIQPTPNGNYKLVAARDRSGHADSAIALALALPRAIELAGVMASNPAKPQFTSYVRRPERFGVRLDLVGNKSERLRYAQ